MVRAPRQCNHRQSSAAADQKCRRRQTRRHRPGDPRKSRQIHFCFAEDESDDARSTLAMDQGYSREESVVSLFAGDGVQPILDQLSRTPESRRRAWLPACDPLYMSKSSVWPMPCSWYAPNTDGCCERTDGHKQDLLQAIHDELVTPGAELIGDRRHRGRHAGQTKRQITKQIPGRWPAYCYCWRHGRRFGHHQRLGGFWRKRQSTCLSTHLTMETQMSTMMMLDPTSEHSPAERQLLPRLKTLVKQPLVCWIFPNHAARISR